MADAPAKPDAALDFLKQKVGPLPLGVWLLMALGLVFYLQKKNSASATGTGSAVPNQQTDPAGNIGSIDPATGYVYGTPEDTAALAANNAGTATSTTTGTTGTTSTTTAGAYADNNSWAQAAINYLVGLGIDPSSANEAIEQYLNGQTLTTQQQADVNEAIQSLGAPPTVPGPTGTPPVNVVTPPATTTPTGTVYATNPPTGVTVSSKTASTVSLKWNKSANATGYTVGYGKTSAANTWSTTAPAAQAGITIGNLDANTLYYFRVQATPAQSGAAAGTAQATTAKAAAAASPAKASSPAKAPAAAAATTYTVKSGDTLTSIAAKYKYPGGEAALYAANKAVIGSNPGLIKPGQVLKV
jgi:LysM repeat protein